MTLYQSNLDEFQLLAEAPVLLLYQVDVSVPCIVIAPVASATEKTFQGYWVETIIFKVRDWRCS